jgi:hypothetical protein
LVRKLEGKRPLVDLGLFVWIIFGWVCGEKTVYRSLVVKPDGKRPLGRPSRRWVDNIRMDLLRDGVYRVLVV